MSDSEQFPEQNGPIFIVGPSRSGTTLLRGMLGRHPEVMISAETHWFDDLRPRLGGGEHKLEGAALRQCEDWFLGLAHRPFGHQGVPDEGWLKREPLVERAQKNGATGDAHFEAFCQLDAERYERRRWGEKTPRHVFRMADILVSYPNARFLCLVRDARAVVTSYRNWRTRGGFDFIKDPGHVAALKEEHHRTRASYHPLIASFMWRGAVRAAIQGRKAHGKDKVRLVRYEDLVQDPVSHLTSIAQWLGLEFDANMLEVPIMNSTFSDYETKGGVTTKSVESWRERLSAKEVAAVQSVCGATLAETGYENNPVSLLSWPWVLWSWLSLPFAGIRAARANRGRIHGGIFAYLARRLGIRQA